ncbi:MAG: CotH kinase family protein [Vicinamibacterales bacterium]
MRRRAATIRAVLTFVAWACTATAWAQTPAPTPTPTPAPDPTADFFNDDTVQDIRLTINPKDWNQLKLEFQQNTYYGCHFGWKDQLVKNVAIRSRGTGSRSGVKPGLRVDFDRYTAKQRFLGLKSVVLRNNTQDPTMLHERVAMKFFQRMGVPVSREAHARLFVNDVYAGLYTIVEAVDKDFLSRHFQENDGFLYKYDYDAVDDPYYFTYNGSDPGLYSPKPFEPETHEKDPDPRPIEAMIKVINEAPDSEFLGAIAEFLDLSKFLTHVATENFLGEIDGFLGNYAMNNFYLYRFEKKNLSAIIPWDKSHTFFVGPEHSIWHNIDAPSWLRNRLMERIMEFPDLVDFYVNALGKAAEIAAMPPVTTTLDPTPSVDAPIHGPKKGWLETEVERQFDQIREFALDDKFKPHSNGEFQSSVQHLLFFARQRADFVRLQVDRHFGR